MSFADMIKKSKPNRTRDGLPAIIDSAKGKHRRHRDDRVAVNIAEAEEAGRTFGTALEKDLTELMDIDKMFADVMFNTLLHIGRSDSGIQDGLARLHDFIETCSNEELPTALKLAADIRDKGMRQVLTIKELEILRQFIAKWESGRLPGSAEEVRMAAVSEEDRTLLDGLKRNPAGVYRVLNFINYAGQVGPESTDTEFIETTVEEEIIDNDTDQP